VIGPICNLKSAVQLAESSDLDAALLDLNINGAYATEVADKLRARRIPFIFVTGYRLPGLRYQDVPVLRKPFTELELRAALVALFNG
jgi:CheY-like chemotaxis protein